MPSLNLDAVQGVHLVTDMRCLAISWTRQCCRWRQKWDDAVMHQIRPTANNEKLDALTDRMCSALEHSALVFTDLK